MSDQSDPHRKITVRFILSWIFGVLFLLAGVMYLFSQPLPAIMYILASLIILPPAVKFYEKKGNIKISGALKFIAIIICLGIAGATFDLSELNVEVPNVDKSPTSTTSKQKISEPKLELQSMRTYKEYNFAHIDGMVKNVSGEKMENIMAVGEFYDENDNFIKSAEALIEYDPILPGQSSPFSVLTSDNPEIKNGKIVFKKMWGGTISTKDSRQK